jgi:hypothetical protein
VTTYERSLAESDWLRARRKLLYQEVVCHIKACSVDLFSFDKLRNTLNLKQKVYRGLQEVRVDHIRGSVGRYTDFSSAFLPRKKHMRDRWLGIDLAMQKGITPPVELYQIGQTYFVMDGNHRVSVAKELDYITIEAEVWEFPSPSGSNKDSDLDQELIRLEQDAFRDRVGVMNTEAARSIVFTQPGGCEALAGQIEIYRAGVQQNQNISLSFEEAFQAWYEEVYLPAIEAIREMGILPVFPDRTEADLFIWAWKNGMRLEDLELGKDADVN